MFEKIKNGQTYLGIELGSTRIKASLIDETATPLASGSYDWENTLTGGYWSYSVEEIHKGIKGAYKSLKKDVLEKYNVTLTSFGAIGISGMMHGYIALDNDDKFLVPFRTWRNTTTEKAATELSELFKFNVPQRWSIAHLYQAILNNEEHVKDIKNITTLSSYIHYLLTGKREIGICEASGMFPVKDGDYDAQKLEKFDELIAGKEFLWNIRDILPKVKMAGEGGTYLTKEGAKFLDDDGDLVEGIPVCPPEGDAGTGMVATNAVAPKTGNISAGTSVFAMLVLENNLKGMYPEIDMVTTPDGYPVAMVHCNNCSSEIDAWVKLFLEFAKLIGADKTKAEIYDMLYINTLNAKENCAGVVSYNYLSGEHVTNVVEGRPMYFRLPDSEMNLASFFKSQLYSCFASLKLGMDILFEKENINAEVFQAHGGLFKTEKIAQQILANALNTPISVSTTAGEGGAWGMAVLALYMQKGNNVPLSEWLASNIFASNETKTLNPEKEGVEGFSEYINLYKAGLEAERKLGEAK